MSETRQVDAGRVLRHVKSDTYITEYSDRTAILISDAPGSRTVTLIYGRDTAEILEENLQKAEGQLAQLTPTQIDTFRLDLASITLPAAAARAMAESILRTLDDADARASGGA